MAVPWELTASALERLLVRLDPDPARAADAYEALRLSLTRFFDWRGAHFPDECADETMNRLARRLDEGAAVADIRGFALGIARLVRLERARSPQVRQDELDEEWIGPAPAAVERDPEPRLHECLEACLASLAPDARTLILEVPPGPAAAENRSPRPPGHPARALRQRAAQPRPAGAGSARALRPGVRRRRATDTKPGSAHFPRGDAAGDRPRAAALRQTDDAP